MTQIHAEYALDLPGYEILRELGRGGVSTVYLARHELLERRVAIKVMSPVLAVEEGFNRRFIREGQTIAQLKHPGIVTVYDVAVVDHRPFIAMEYLPGGSLKDRMKAPIPPAEAIALLKSITESLGYAHQRGVFHRDVKPENILFRENGDPVLTDFGIAKWESQDTAFTSVGIVVGTPRYISPEQAQGQGSDARSDIYALGVILYEMLTGQPPYNARGSMSLLYAHINDPIPRLPEKHGEYQALVDDLMAKEPERRIPDCETLTMRLARVESGEADGSDVARAPRKSSRWPMIMLTALVLPAAVLLLWWHGYRFGFDAQRPEQTTFKKMVANLLAPDNAPASRSKTRLPQTALPAPPSSPAQGGGGVAAHAPVVGSGPHSAGTDGGKAARGGASVAAVGPARPGTGNVNRASGLSWNYKAPQSGDDQPSMTPAVRAYERGAEQGHPVSEFYLGLAYGNGDGVEHDEARALHWLALASQAGVRDAKYNLILGEIFGSQPNLHAAAKMALELASRSYAPVYPILGWMYNTGTGVDSSFVQSVRWNMKTMVGAVTGRAGPPGKVVRRWEQQLQVQLGKIRDTKPAQPDILVR